MIVVAVVKRHIGYKYDEYSSDVIEDVEVFKTMEAAMAFRQRWENALRVRKHADIYVLDDSTWRLSYQAEDEAWVTYEIQLAYKTVHQTLKRVGQPELMPDLE